MNAVKPFPTCDLCDHPGEDLRVYGPGMHMCFDCYSKNVSALYEEFDMLEKVKQLPIDFIDLYLQKESSVILSAAKIIFFASVILLFITAVIFISTKAMING